MSVSLRKVAWSSPRQDAREPLLQAQQDPPHRCVGQHCRATASSNLQDPPQPATEVVDLGGRFLQRLWRITCIINAAPALVLVLVSLAETVIVSKIGTISGLFYQVFVDGQASRVPHLMLWSAGCYTATVLFYALKSGLQDCFAWRWRAALTLQLQQAYCGKVGATCPQSKAPLLQSLDSPDQRVAQDLPLLTTSLAEVVTQLAAVPFNIFWYTHLTQQVFGSWLPVWSAYLFFLLGLVLQRLVMLPVAAAVFKQEAAEGAFRYAHTRFRAWASEIAFYRSESIEQEHLEVQLSSVLVCQGRLMLRRAVLAATSRLLEYGGLVVNFGCLAAAVFSGAWSGGGGSAGDMASKVSVASFYLLTLIYNFSQVLDLASKVANLAGLTARVGQMLEVLDGGTSENHTSAPGGSSSNNYSSAGSSSSNSSRSLATSRQQDSEGSPNSSSSRKRGGMVAQFLMGEPESHHHHQQQQQQQQQLQVVAAGKSPSHQRYASQAVLLQPPQLVLLHTPHTPDTTNSNNTAQHTGGAQRHETAVGAAAAAAADGPDGQGYVGQLGTQQYNQQQHIKQQQNKQQQQQQQQLDGSLQLPGPGQQQQSVLAAAAAAADRPVTHPITQGAVMSHPPGVMMSHPPGVLMSHSPGVLMSHPHQELMQLSVHSMGADMLLQEVRRAFPDSPRLPPLLAVVTFQFCGAAKTRMLAKLQQQQQQQQPVQSSSSEGVGTGGSCCPTCAGGPVSCAGGGAGGVRQPLCGDGDMQHMLGVFLQWQQVVFDYITSRGYWCDTIDPRSGTALHSTSGSHYDEVIGASVLLGYEQVTPSGQGFSLISHPEAATQVYPATLFTSAPLPLLRKALRAAAGAGSPAVTPAVTPAAGPPLLQPDALKAPPAAPHAHSQVAPGMAAAAGAQASCSSLLNPIAHNPAQCSTHLSSSDCAQQLDTSTVQQHQQQQQHQHQLLLSCTRLTVSTPAGAAIVRELCLQVVAGKCVLIQGPSGSGKSTLLSCLAGLWPPEAGRISMAAAAAAAGGGGGGAYAAAAGATAGCDASWPSGGNDSCATGSSCSWQQAAGQQQVAAVGQPLVQPQLKSGDRGDTTGADCCSLSGIMFVPQRPLAAPGATLRHQLLYPATANPWPCSCGSSSSSSSGSGGRRCFLGAHQPKQQQRCDHRQGVRSHYSAAAQGGGWWLNWLSCGLNKQHISCGLNKQHISCGLNKQHISCGLNKQHIQPPVMCPGVPVPSCKHHQRHPQQQQQQPCSNCQHLVSVLEAVGLSYLLARLPYGVHTAHDCWGEVLSPGELQRLTVARVLLQRPVLAVLDEATSSLPDAAAVQLYRQLQAAGISYVSVGHSRCLAEVHHTLLSISGDNSGCWGLSELQE